MNSQVIRSSGGAVTGFNHDLTLTTIDVVPGQKVQQVIGLVRGNSIRARHVGRDITALLKNIVGGELKEYTKLLAESREQAIDRMVDQAVQMGANGVLGLRFSTSMVMGGAAEILAYGTAVILEPIDPA